jgi:hypothetical protein
MQMKISFKSIRNPENVKQSKTLIKSNGFLSIKHSDLDPEIISLLTKIKKQKTCKMTKKDFQSLKTNQWQVLNSEKSQILSTKSSSQVIKEKLGDRRQKGPIQQILQETLQLSSKVQCGKRGHAG